MTLTKTSIVFALVTAFAGSASQMAFAQGEKGTGPDHGPMPMMNFEAIDANKDGKVTVEEFDAFRTAEFAKTDTNSDGQLSADEMVARRVADMTARATEMATMMIQRADSNGDGQLSAAEMAEGPRPKTMFERADTDGDGAITKMEVETLQGKMGHKGKWHRKG